MAILTLAAKSLWNRRLTSALVVFAIALFAVQVVASQLWLKHFRFGPLEWLWRAFTYMQWPPLRRDKPATA